MTFKDGFLLIELMIGLVILFFFILIITHYIIEIKNTQQTALENAQALNYVRNQLEKIKAGHDISSHHNKNDISQKFFISFLYTNHVLQDDNNTKVQLVQIINTWKNFKKEKTLSLFFYKSKLNNSHEK